MSQGRAHKTVYKSRSRGEPLVELVHQTPPEKAISTLKALVLFSALWPFKILTMTARIMISPAELMGKDIYDCEEVS
jgi:hypothetical protein